jgi:DNA polymerase III delta prime subunit
MNYSDFIKKHSPRSSSELLDNRKIINQIKDFLQNDGSNLILRGPNGIGKTTLIDVLLKEFSLEKKIPNLNTSIKKPRKDKKKKGSNDPIKSYYNQVSEMIDSDAMMKGELKYIKFAMVIDNIDRLSGKNEKSIIKDLNKINFKEKKFPLIIICGTNHNKTIKQMENTSLLLSMYPPSEESFVKHIKHIGKVENIKFQNDSIIRTLLDFSGHDMRKLMINLYNIKLMYKNKIIKEDDINEYQKTSIIRNMNIDIYSATTRLFNNYQPFDDAHYYYRTEKTIIPMMVHRNYILHINRQYNKLNPKKKMELIEEISKTLVNGDIVENFIYSNQAWNMTLIHSYFSCGLVSYLINKHPGKRNIYIHYNNFNQTTNQESDDEEESAEPVQNEEEESSEDGYTFPKDMNRTCIKRINQKHISKTQNSYVNAMDVEDFLHIIQIVKHYIKNENYEELENFLKNYNTDHKLIKYLLKIDRISESSLTEKEEKTLKKIYNDSEKVLKKIFPCSDQKCCKSHIPIQSKVNSKKSTNVKK